MSSGGDGGAKKAEPPGGGGGAGGGVKKVELKPHPAMETLDEVQYCVQSPPPWFESVLLGFQHYLLVLGMTVLIPSIIVPQMGGDNIHKAKVIQTQLFISGLSTLMQTLFGTRLPSVVGGSYAFMIPITSIIQARRYQRIKDPHERFTQTMAGIQGALIVTSAFQMIMGFFGLWRNVARVLSPLSAVPLVTFTGLGLYYLAFPMLAKCIAIGLPELVIMIIISQYLPPYIKSKRPICDRFAVLASVAIVWVFAGILTWSDGPDKKSTDALTGCRTDRAGLVKAAPWFYVPYPFQWGAPTFTTGEAFAMIISSFVASIESTGTYIATARYGSATPVPPSIMSRGIGWLGIGTLLNGFCGSVTGSTASVENAGLLALTRVASRRVAQISAGFMILFSVVGKFGAIFASIPMPIVAALYCILFGYVSSAGLGNLQFCNLNSFRTKLILGLSFSLGFTIPQYFREHQVIHQYGPIHTHAQWFNDMVSVFFGSHVTVAAAVAVFLDQTLPRGSDEQQKDSGLHWWEKFRSYKSDLRSDEFYRLPGNLNKLFPPL
ncbi:nucleobase-ascorbate transporter 6-like [Apium graveolens]|uniref:nucleobase-ascorbate transporter 6-like n=1 Tax=Apium graveolens TaxID=4045 RepID=UPI003D79FA0A